MLRAVVDGPLAGCTPKEVLEALDEWGEAAEWEEGAQVWNVLTALRGPDDAEMMAATDKKVRTTLVIRKKAFPKWADRFSAPPLSTAPDVVILKPGDGAHFASHITYAWDALQKMGVVK